MFVRSRSDADGLVGFICTGLLLMVLRWKFSIFMPVGNLLCLIMDVGFS